MIRLKMHWIKILHFLPAQQAQVDWMHVGTVIENEKSLIKFAFVTTNRCSLLYPVYFIRFIFVFEIKIPDIKVEYLLVMIVENIITVH